MKTPLKNFSLELICLVILFSLFLLTKIEIVQKFIGRIDESCHPTVNMAEVMPGWEPAFYKPSPIASNDFNKSYLKWLISKSESDFFYSNDSHVDYQKNGYYGGFQEYFDSVDNRNSSLVADLGVEYKPAQMLHKSGGYYGGFQEYFECEDDRLSSLSMWCPRPL